MSVWATILDFDDYWLTIPEFEAAEFYKDLNIRSPVMYKGSHHTPSLTDERDGSLGVSTYRDWLRLDVEETVVVLTPEQSKLLHRALTEWLDARDRMSDEDKAFEENEYGPYSR